jgi:hypothetical protein
MLAYKQGGQIVTLIQFLNKIPVYKTNNVYKSG